MRWSTSFLCNLCYRCQVHERSEEDSGSRCDDLVMSEHKEQWSTPDSIRDAHERLLARATGWQPPAAYGIAYLPEGAGGPNEPFPVVNVGSHSIPATVLGLVTGHRSGSATYILDRASLYRAIKELEPAEAAVMYPHPNLYAWRDVAARMGTGRQDAVVAVFVGDLEDTPSSAYDKAFREQIAAGDRAAPYENR